MEQKNISGKTVFDPQFTWSFCAYEWAVYNTSSLFINLLFWFYSIIYGLICDFLKYFYSKKLTFYFWNCTRNASLIHAKIDFGLHFTAIHHYFTYHNIMHQQRLLPFIIGRYIMGVSDYT